MKIEYVDGLFFGDETLWERGFGKRVEGRVLLEPEEVLYVAEFFKPKLVNFELEDVYAHVSFASWMVFKDWREKGLFAKRDVVVTPQADNLRVYPEQRMSLDVVLKKGVFFEDVLMSVVNDSRAKTLYEQHWFGQFGNYKQHHRGFLTKYDVFETLFLLDKGVLALNVSRERVFELAQKRIPDFASLFTVYTFWRERGYVVKSGFKFGTHFRIYFPGAKPVGKRVHSKHLLHVFPNHKMLISEWARTVRVAHSVRKTFILAIPSSVNRSVDVKPWFLFFRTGSRAHKPNTHPPSFMAFPFFEDQLIGVEDFAQMLWYSKAHGLPPVLAVVDRESSVTYYTLNLIKTPNSPFHFCEIEW